MRQVLVLVISVVTQVIYVTSSCPWDDPELKRWSEESSWPTGEVPKENEAVVIPAGTKILLDTKQIPRLLTLTIDGVLVWGDVDDIRLETSYILVNGEFHMGSEDCRFEREADIFLYGKSNSSETVQGFGRKFIGVRPNSKLEIHGKEKKSWSKLVATVSPTAPGSCGLKYDSKDQTVKTRTGIWLQVWNSDGSFLSLDTYDTQGSKATVSVPAIEAKIQNTPAGSIISLAVYRTLGAPTDAFEDLYLVIESLGGSKIRDLGEYEPYMFLAQKGQTSNAVEKFTQRPTGVYGGLDAEGTFTLGDLAFMAKSYSFYDGSKSKGDVTFRVLSKDVAFPKLSLLHDVTTWETGDEVVVASTDFDWRQAEVRKIVDCDDCEANQIRVDGDFLYSHFGEVTYGVDERAEVGLLSRNIRVDAEMQHTCYAYTEHEQYLCDLLKKDTFGGHTKVLCGAHARIEGVQLTHMGQQAVLATYPLHFHLAAAVPGQYLRNNVIRDSNSRCVTIHGTDHLEVSNNVCFNHLGHGLFLEDSAEQNNTIHRNLIIGTQHGTLLFTDRDVDWCTDRSICGLLSSYWITHPNNYFTENVAAGSDASGMVFAFSDRPLGPSLEIMKARGLYEDRITRYTKVGKFHRNVMHSNKLAGLWFDNMISYGQYDMNKFVPETGKLGLNLYCPKDPPKPDGESTVTELTELVMYKNPERNSWVRCGNIIIANSSFADSPTSYVGAHTVDETFCEVKNSIFIGETDNKGEPYTHVFNDAQFQYLPKASRPRHHFDRSIPRNRPDFMISGVQFYQGPMFLDNCFFDQFFNWYYNDSFIDTWGMRPMRPAAALNFHPNNHYPTVPTNGVRNVKFGFCDGRDDSFRVMDGNASTPWWNVFDGTGNIMFRDYDGSLTANENTVIVDDRPFFTGLKCLKKEDWGLSICPYKYVLMVVRGSSGVLKDKYKGKTPVLISRDDNILSYKDVYAQTGSTGHKYNLRVNKSYTVWFNSTIGGGAPRDIQFRPRFGLEKNETIRIAVCLPKSTTTFTIYSKEPVLHPKKSLYPVFVDSLKQLDRDETMTAFFWDQANGYLYFKMRSPHSLENPAQECPGNVCLEVNIIRVDGDDDPAVCDTPVSPWIKKDRNRFVKNRICKVPDSPEGLGAPIETGFSAPDTSGGTCE